MTPATAERFIEKRVRGRPARAMVIPFGAVPLAEAGSRPLDPACAAGDPRGDPRGIPVPSISKVVGFTSRAKLTSRTRPRYKPPLSVTANCMANHKSAEKRIRQAAKRTAINRARVSRVRTFVKKVETAIETGDKATAMSALRLAQPELHRAITKGVLHKNTVSRKLSRLAARINAL